MKNLLKSLKIDFKSWSGMKKVAIIFTVIFCIFAYFFVTNALKTSDFVKQKKPAEKAEEIKPVQVSLIVYYNDTQTRYDERMENQNAVLGLFEKLRQNNQFTYEKFAYTYGTEIDNINGIPAPEGKKWRVFVKLNQQNVDDLTDKLDIPEEEQQVLDEAVEQRTDITYEINTLNLVDNAIYEIELVDEGQVQGIVDKLD